jgi:hypothetical protein
MSDAAAQNLKNHAKFDPPYHMVLATVLAVNLIFSIVYAISHFNIYTGWLVILSIAIWIPVLRLRQYPLKVQDRVIRLEERLRLVLLAPEEWRTQIERLTEDQLIALRFASDEEVVGLAKDALTQNLSRKQIKERIKVWRADHWRI